MADLRSQLATTLTGAYTIERELGGGGMSRVFVADELRLGRKVVVKVLSPDLAAGISADRFEREIKLAASLQQANIVPVLSAGDTNGLPYYTMPFVEGESLRARLARSAPLPINETLRILGDVARALQYAHERGIVHRDIKPDNVLLSGGTAVVTDFGIAKALSASRTGGNGATLTQLGTSIGTPAYMSPEQAAGDPDVDNRADIYAFGCMAYELLTGHPPFHGRTPHRTLAAHMTEAPQTVSQIRGDVPAGLATLVMRCLDKTPERRPASAADLIQRLESITSGGGMTAMPPVLLGGPGAFRKALLLYVVGFALVALLAKAATIAIDLPDWVFPGALLVMALGLPIVLFTGYVQSVARRVLAATPQLTPGGGQPVPSTMATLALKASPHVSWRRTTRGGLMAVGGFVVVILAFMIMRAFGIGPAASLFGAGRLNAADPLLVANFTVSHADSSVGSVVAEAVRTSLGESKSIRVVNPTAVAATLRLMERPVTTPLDMTLAREVALRQGLKAIVTGDVTGLGNGYVVALRLVSADSGSVLAAYQTTVDGPSELVNGVDEVTRKLRGKIGESLAAVRDNPPLAQVSTASLEALRDFTIGERANDLEGNDGKAIEYLRRAVAIDTGFAMAWRKLAVVEGNASLGQAVVDSAIGRAYAHADRLTTHDSLLTAAYYFERGPGHDRQRAQRAYEALMRNGDTAYANNLALNFGQRRQYAAAESLFRMNIRATPSMGLAYSNLARARVSEGHYAEAMAAARDGAVVMQGLPLTIAADVRLSKRQLDSVQPALDSLVAAATPTEPLIGWQLQAQVDATRGRIADAERATARFVALDSTSGTPLSLANRAGIEAAMQGWVLGHSAFATAYLDSVTAGREYLSLSVSDRQYPVYAIMYAQLGQPAKARAQLARAARELHDPALLRTWEPAIHAANAEIALAENRASDAIREFRQSDSLSDGPEFEDPLPMFMGLARAFDLANQPDSAIVYFEKYVHSTFVDRTFDDMQFLAGTYKRLGELYEERGDAQRAMDYTQRFIDLWKNADPELQPKVAEARARLARLRSRSRSG